KVLRGGHPARPHRPTAGDRLRGALPRLRRLVLRHGRGDRGRRRIHGPMSGRRRLWCAATAGIIALVGACGREPLLVTRPAGASRSLIVRNVRVLDATAAELREGLWDVVVREGLIAANEAPGAVGPVFTAPGGHPAEVLRAWLPWYLRWYVLPRATREVATAEDGRRAVAALLPERPDILKLAIDAGAGGDVPCLAPQTIAAITA